MSWFINFITYLRDLYNLYLYRGYNLVTKYQQDIPVPPLKFDSSSLKFVTVLPKVGYRGGSSSNQPFFRGKLTGKKNFREDMCLDICMFRMFRCVEKMKKILSQVVGLMVIYPFKKRSPSTNPNLMCIIQNWLGGFKFQPI